MKKLKNLSEEKFIKKTKLLHFTCDTILKSKNTQNLVKIYNVPVLPLWLT